MAWLLCREMLSVLGCGTSASHPLLLDPQAFAYDAVGNRTKKEEEFRRRESDGDHHQHHIAIWRAD